MKASITEFRFSLLKAEQVKVFVEIQLENGTLLEKEVRCDKPTGFEGIYSEDFEAIKTAVITTSNSVFNNSFELEL